jgi:hydrogenase expression/formation protein HypE
MEMMVEDKIILAHGSGGKLSHDLIKNTFLPRLGNTWLARLDDSAVVDIEGKVAFTTDSYVVSPIFFPGGDIGRLAVCGTVNDLSMSGARPLYLSLSLIIEEGLTLADLERIVISVQNTADESGVKVVAGDTKVVQRGTADKLFINTSGIGVIAEGANISGANAQSGDAIIINGPIGDHGIAVMSQREGLKFHGRLESDCAPLNELVVDMLAVCPEIHCLRDPTRGGLATTLNEFASQSDVGMEIYEKDIPLRPAVRAVCEILGLDPLHVANEGKLVAIVPAGDAEQVLAAMKKNRYGAESAIIGEVIVEHPGRVVMKTRLDTSRILSMMVGDLLPRIC